MRLDKPITEIIQQRFSCRTYLKKLIEDDHRKRLAGFLANLQEGPLGNRTRFELVAATSADSANLKGLGTYGFIRNPAAFIIGTTFEGDKNLEDFGYQMEKAILSATDLGLGTCWLGGTFTKSKFAQKIDLSPDEIIPAVTSVGYIAKKPRWLDGEVRRIANADRRLPWERLFFDTRLGTPLSKEQAGEYALPIEMVRLAPSASNRQPWRIVRVEETWHFYLMRTPGYLNSNTARLLKLADLQRVDMGIAMCHFELSARDAGLEGHWAVTKPDLYIPGKLTEYVVSWAAKVV